MWKWIYNKVVTFFYKRTVCGKQHSQFPDYYCALRKRHDGWCQCALGKAK